MSMWKTERMFCLFSDTLIIEQSTEYQVVKSDPNLHHELGVASVFGDALINQQIVTRIHRVNMSAGVVAAK